MRFRGEQKECVLLRIGTKIMLVHSFGKSTKHSKVSRVNSRVEAAASMQVRSPLWLIGLARGQGVAYRRVFATMTQY